jgi:replication factor C subunit 2/4
MNYELYKNIKLPLVEKYRPKNFNDLLFDDFIKEKIKNIVKSGQIPNMIITGEPSTGKTSTVIYLAKKIFDENYSSHVLELNASDDRGLAMIQQTILPFCKKKTSMYKLIILDEADSITPKAQNLLNNIIAEFKETTRFVFICNEGFKIGESIQSRCMILYFPRISKKNLKKKIKDICINENINCNENGIKQLLFCSNFDIRQCINNLECILYSYGKLTEETVNNIVDIPKIHLLKEIINNCYNKNLEQVLIITKQLYDSGYSANDIILTFMKYIENIDDEEDKNPNMTIQSYVEIYKILSQSFIKINLIDNMVQLSACIVNIYNTIQINKFN